MQTDNRKKRNSHEILVGRPAMNNRPASKLEKQNKEDPLRPTKITRSSSRYKTIHEHLLYNLSF